MGIKVNFSDVQCLLVWTIAMKHLEPQLNTFEVQLSCLCLALLMVSVGFFGNKESEIGRAHV